MTKVAPPPIGTAVKQTTITESIPSVKSNPYNPETRWASWPSGKKPSFWDYWESLTLEERRNHVVYLKRYEGEPGSKAKWLEKFEGNELADGITINGSPIMQFSPEFIMRLYGGGIFQIVVKDGPDRIYDFDDPYEGKPRDPKSEPPQNSADSAPNSNRGDTSDLAQVMNRMMDFIERRDNPAGAQSATSLVIDGARGAMDIQRQAFTSAATTLAAQPGGAPASKSEAMLERVFEILLTRALTPVSPTDPIETFSKMVAAMNTLGFGKAAGSSNIGLELVRALPQVLGTISDGMKNYAMASEAQARIASARGGAPQPVLAPRPVPQPQPPAQVQPNPVAQPAVVAPPPGTAAAADNGRQPWQDMIETQIRNVIVRSQNVEDAADECMTVVVNFDPPDADRPGQSLLFFLTELGEEGLIGVFQASPILNSIPVTPQLRAFIRRFIEIGKMELAPAPAPAAGPANAGAPANPAAIQGNPILVPEPPPAA
jgi:hypothetical protein